MKSSSVFFKTPMLAAPVALWLQASALAQATGDGTTPPPPAQVTGAVTATKWQDVDFYFPGGTPREFISAIEQQYKVDWAKVVEVPENMANDAVRIPALRMNRQSAQHILPSRRFGGRGGGGGGGGDGGSESDRSPLDALIALYNSLSQAKPELGQLMVEGDLTKPSVVLFRSNAQRQSPIASSDFKMKAFALNGIPDKEWEPLEKLVDSELDKLTQLQIFATRDLDEHLSSHEEILLHKEVEREHEARVTLHKDTGLLIVRGSDSILQAAESLVTAWRAKQPATKF
ncbi:MAG TPA: hypothetical protein VK731_12630 [Candidatus Cybelea sp.]|jgi:hypothetical protein|nr:hypothetical protein [Candidatus Cybelea sp.]